MNINVWLLNGLLLLAWANVAESTPIETLADPTVSTTEKLRAKFIAPMTTKQELPPSGTIQDPTTMNGNFRSALNRLDKNKTPAGTNSQSPIVPVASFPDIRLLASVCSHHPQKNHAMISVNGKSKMIGVSDKVTEIINNQVIEIDVLDIQKDQVRLRLHPNNEILILR